MPANILTAVALTDEVFGGLPLWVFIAIAGGVILICVIALIIAAATGKKKAKKKAKKIVEETPQPVPTEEAAAPEAQDVPVAEVPDVTATSTENEEVNLSTLPEDSAVTDQEEAQPEEQQEPAAQEAQAAEQPQAQPVAQAQPESAPAQQPVQQQPVQQPVQQQPVQQQPAAQEVAAAPAQEAVVVAPAPKPKRVPPVRKKKEETAPAAQPAQPSNLPANTTILFDLPESDGARGKYVIVKDESNPMRPYKFQLKANNGQILYESENYKIKPKTKQIESFRNTINNGTYNIDSEKNGTFRYKLFKADGVTLYGVGEGYKSRAAAESAVESVKYFANNSNVLEDSTIEV